MRGINAAKVAYLLLALSGVISILWLNRTLLANLNMYMLFAVDIGLLFVVRYGAYRLAERLRLSLLRKKGWKK